LNDYEKILRRHIVTRFSSFQPALRGLCVALFALLPGM
jgi:hypothetical protein